MITSTCKGSAWLQQDKYHKGTVYYYFFYYMNNEGNLTLLPSRPLDLPWALILKPGTGLGLCGNFS